MADPVNHIASPQEFAALLASNMYVVADFYADWCGPCKTIAPAYAQLAKTHSVPKYLAFAKVNVDTVQAVAAQYSVSAMPTFMFFKNGKQVAVNGNVNIRGADPQALAAAAQKMGRLAKEKADGGA
ncbi:thioredoxin domain-containing protein [Thozetella sp. PMI_491]|nr:thioredoxin domain-containing protein [Thozetella sp. PMI_491]